LKKIGRSHVTSKIGQERRNVLPLEVQEEAERVKFADQRKAPSRQRKMGEDPRRSSSIRVVTWGKKRRLEMGGGDKAKEGGVQIVLWKG